MTGIEFLNNLDRQGEPTLVGVKTLSQLDAYRNKLKSYALAHPELPDVSRAVKNRWNIPPHMREQAMAVIDDVMTAGSREEQVKAVNTLVAMDKANLDEEKMNKPLEININYAELTDIQIEQKLAELDGRNLARLPS